MIAMTEALCVVCCKCASFGNDTPRVATVYPLFLYLMCLYNCVLTSELFVKRKTNSIICSLRKLMFVNLSREVLSPNYELVYCTLYVEVIIYKYSSAIENSLLDLMQFLSEAVLLIGLIYGCNLFKSNCSM